MGAKGKILRLESVTDIIQLERNYRWRTSGPYCREDVRSKLLREPMRFWESGEVVGSSGKEK